MDPKLKVTVLQTSTKKISTQPRALTFKRLFEIVTLAETLTPNSTSSIFNPADPDTLKLNMS